MKVYISADIEGVTGATHRDETILSKTGYSELREQMTAEVVAACEGALAAGASEVWVKDAHDSGRNLLAPRLPHPVRLIRGWSGHPFQMVQELDRGFGALVMIGYHSRAGAGTSPLAHTMTGEVAHLRINDRFASEFLLHGYAGATVGVPVAFVSGDQGLCQEIAAINPAIRTVAVQEGIGASSLSIHPEVATGRIREGVQKALSGDLSACQLPLPDRFELEVCFRSAAAAYRAGFFPGFRQVDATTICLETPDYFEVLRALLFIL